jgi:putative hydrolase of the HAD superfamily
VALPRDALRQAFDEAERRAAASDAMMTAHRDAMVAQHVRWQFDALGAGAPAGREQRLAAEFISGINRTADALIGVLADLSTRFRLGVVSNGCGNVDVLCADLGYAPYLSVAIDSRRVGLYKPDPSIFIHAAARLGMPPSDVLMVGDSFDRDIRPARSVGMKTAWLEGMATRECPEPALVDFRLRTLADLPSVFVESRRTVA